MRVETVLANSPASWVVGLAGMQSERFRKVTLTAADLDRLTVLDAGYDVTSLDLASGELRLIEVKGLGAATGTILLTPNERRVAEDRPDCFWLYVVTDCNNTPRLQEPIRDPARLDWNEVTKVAHYYSAVNAMTKPMQVREDSPPYKGSS
jgi:hypothetical protein